MDLARMAITSSVLTGFGSAKSAVDIISGCELWWWHRFFFNFILKSLRETP
jgi:hypothetical protein